MSQQLSPVENKPPTKPARRPGNPGRPSPAHHQALCKVCQHPDKTEIQEHYMRGVSSRELAKDFHLSPDSIRRHVRYFSLDARRAHDVASVLRLYLSRHLDKFLDDEAFSPQAFIKTAGVLAKIPDPYAPNHIQPGSDSCYQYRRRLFNSCVDELILTEGKTEKEARTELFKECPEAETVFGP